MNIPDDVVDELSGCLSIVMITPPPGMYLRLLRARNRLSIFQKQQQQPVNEKEAEYE